MSKLATLLAPYFSISIIGLGKNVGKTTVLNHIIEGFGKLGQKLALTSIGRDGEEVDVVTNTAKPQIFVSANTVIITAEGLLRHCDATLEILDTTGLNTPLGRIVVVRTLTGGFVQLAGPSIISQMVDLLENLPNFGVDKIIIDGAISRKSLAGPDLARAAVLCTGAALGPDMDFVISQTRHNLEMLMLNSISENESDCIYLDGVVSDAVILKLMATQGRNLVGKRIVAEDPGKIFVSGQIYEKLQIRRASLGVRKGMNIAAVAINPTSPAGFAFEPVEFLNKMQTTLLVPVFDVRMEG